MLVVIYMGRAAGMTSMDLLRTLGTMVAPKASNPVVYGVGLMTNLMMGGPYGLAHAGLLHAVDPTSDGAGRRFRSFVRWGARHRRGAEHGSPLRRREARR